MSLCLGYWCVLDLTERKSPETLAKLGILVKVYLFPWDTEVLLCGKCLLPGKIMVFLILNELIDSYSQ